MITIWSNVRGLVGYQHRHEPSIRIGPSDMDVLPGNVQAVGYQFGDKETEFIIVEDEWGAYFIHKAEHVMRSAQDIVDRLLKEEKLEGWISDAKAA